MSAKPFVQRFPWSLIFPPRTPEGVRRSVIDLSLYSAAVGALFAAFSLQVGAAIIASVGILMLLFSIVLLIRIKWLQKFGRTDSACIALVLLSLLVGTDMCWVMLLSKQTVLSVSVVSGTTIFWAITSLRYLLRTRGFADRAPSVL